MSDLQLYRDLLIQLSLVSAVALAFRRRVPPAINILVAALFVTVPIAVYQPLGSEGQLFLLDVVAPVLAFGRIMTGDRMVGRSTAKLAWIILLFPLLYAPIGLLFVESGYLPFHSFLLASVLYRSLIIVCAINVMERGLQGEHTLALARLVVWQSLVLLALGVAQYVLGADFVIFELLRNVARTPEYHFEPTAGIYYGLGFLGLFRGAVAVVPVVAAFWGLLLALHPRSKPWERFALDFIILLGLVCVLSALTRAGVIALVAVAIVAAALYSRLRFFLLLYAGLAVGLLVEFGQALFGGQLATFLAGRFSLAELLARKGSGVTREHAAIGYLHRLLVDWKQWLVGVGGFNPLTLDHYFGVFGMHDGYLDILVRYGLVAGIVIVAVLLAGGIKLTSGWVGGGATRRALSRAFLAFMIGTLLLSVTQETLTFYGSAGYLTAAQLWFTIAFAMKARQHAREEDWLQDANVSRRIFGSL